MSLTREEEQILKKAVFAHRCWRVARYLLIPITIAAFAAAIYFPTIREYAEHPLTRYLSGLIISVFVALFGLLISGWTDERNVMLIRLLREKQNL